MGLLCRPPDSIETHAARINATTRFISHDTLPATNITNIWVSYSTCCGCFEPSGAGCALEMRWLCPSRVGFGVGVGDAHLPTRFDHNAHPGHLCCHCGFSLGVLPQPLLRVSAVGELQNRLRDTASFACCDERFSSPYSDALFAPLLRFILEAANVFMMCLNRLQQRSMRRERSLHLLPWIHWTGLLWT